MNPDVLVIGAGPAGLSAATTLAARGVDVLVLDREAAAGGIPRHSAHLGYGIRDRHRFQSGPAYAAALVAGARRAGVRIRTQAMVTGWAGERTVEVTSPSGRMQLTASAIILATGARERPRSARMIPGSRPSGVWTTGQLQNLVHSSGPPLRVALPLRVAEAVVVGAEAVSWSAVLTLRHAGVRTVLMTTEYASPPAYRVLTLAGRIGLRVPVATRTRVTAIHGRERVSGVEVDTAGARRTVACDAVVFTADWIPDHELVRLAGLDLDPGTLGPLIDTAGQTSRAGVFAAGNLVHPVDTADIAALDGRELATAVTRWLERGPLPVGRPAPVRLRPVRLRPGTGVRWVTPGLIDPSGRVISRLSAWIDESIAHPRVVLEQDGQVVAEQALRWPAGPGRVVRIPASVLDRVDPGGGEASLGLHRRG